MEKYTMFIHQKNQYSENEYTTQSNLQIQCNPYQAAAAKSLQSCPTLCDPIDSSPPGFPVPGILQATMEWVAISSSNAWKWNVKVKSLSRVRILATPWTAAHQAPLSMGFSRQEYWSGVPLPSPLLSYRWIQIRGFWLSVCFVREWTDLTYRFSSINYQIL